MLKIKIFALVFAILMTLLTIYLLPIICNAYVHWTSSFNPQQKQWFNYSQAGLGAIMAGLALWHWRKQRKKLKE